MAMAEKGTLLMIMEERERGIERERTREREIAAAMGD